MYYKREGKLIQYKLVTDPSEAEYWTTHRFKKSEIKIMTKCDRQTAAQLRQEIFDDIISREPNPSKKSPPAADKVPQRSKATKSTNAKTRKTKRKTW